MPFRSTAQQRFMFARHPGIAHRWADEMKSSRRKGAREHPIKAANLPSRIGKANLDIAGEMNRLGGVFRGNSGQTAIARRKARSFASRKRFDLARRAQMTAESRYGRIGKRDDWEVPMDHFDSTQPRVRPNYRDGSGNVVGKRMTGTVAGVAKPKKVQPTRVAPRTAAAAVKIPKIGEPPVAPHLVGKRVTRRDAAIGGSAYVLGNLAGRDHERTGKKALRRQGIIVGKRDRRYNPEDSRQRRIGGAAALATGAGALLTHRGIQGVREATRLSRRGIKFAPTSGRPAVILEEEGKAKRVIPVPERDRVRANDLHSHGITAGRGDLARLGGGTALMGAGVGINRYGRSRSNREYR